MPSKTAPGRWRRISHTQALELVIGGVHVASIRKAGPGIYLWRLFGAPQTEGHATSEYAAQRAVRRALKEEARDD